MAPTICDDEHDVSHVRRTRKRIMKNRNSTQISYGKWRHISNAGKSAAGVVLQTTCWANVQSSSHTRHSSYVILTRHTNHCRRSFKFLNANSSTIFESIFSLYSHAFQLDVGCMYTICTRTIAHWAVKAATVEAPAPAMGLHRPDWVHTSIAIWLSGTIDKIYCESMTI